MTTESYTDYGVSFVLNGVELGKCRVNDYPEPVMGTRDVTNHGSGGVAETMPNKLVKWSNVTLDLILVPATMPDVLNKLQNGTIGTAELTNEINVWTGDVFVISAKQNPADATQPNTMTASVVLGSRAGWTITTVTEGEFANLSTKSYLFAPDLGTATYVHAAITLLNGASQDVTTSITNPDFPRIVSLKGNQAGITGDGVVTGTDFNNSAISETIALNGASEVFSSRAFKSVTNIHLPARNGVGDTVSVGVGDVFGLPIATPDADLIFATAFNGSADAGTVNASGTLSLSTYDLAGTPDGSKVAQIWYLA